MYEPDLPTLVRNILFAQALAVLVFSGQAFEVRRVLRRIWISIHAPAQKQEIPKNHGKFFEIDFTKFEP